MKHHQVPHPDCSTSTGCRRWTVPPGILAPATPLHGVYRVLILGVKKSHQPFLRAFVFMANTDAHLVIQFQNGDRKAFTMLVARYEKPIFNASFRMVKNFDDAADITQNAFIKAYEKIDSFNPSYKFFNWLYKIAINETLNLINRRKRRRDFEFDPPARLPSPEDDLELNEMGHFLQKALDCMSYDQRIVIVLKHLLLLPYSEISDILGIPEKTVKSRLFSSRHVLRSELIKQGYVR
jgi:RNA polymerase sigma-70 factor (ECF subfamily)